MTMDDEDVEDLLAGADLLGDSSQESLTNAAANLFVREQDVDEDGRHLSSKSVLVTTNLRDAKEDNAGLSHNHVNKESAIPSVQTTTNDAEAYSCSGGYPLPSVIQKVETIFEGIADELSKESNELTITLKIRPKAATGTSISARLDTATLPTPKTRRICFPGKTEEEAWRFTVIIRTLELIHEALRNGIVLSKRDVYYRDPALFGSQSSVNRAVDDIACTFGVPRQKLNVVAAAKGLVAGAITFCRRDGSVSNASSDRDGMLVPNLNEVLSVDMSAVKWILVIEKEATFRSIAASDFWDVISTQGLLITGKGYPDIATRALLHFLSMSTPQNGFASPPVYGLVDCDPDGLAILSVYKNGSLALLHENANLRVPQLQWLGLRTDHMVTAGSDAHASQGLLSLTERDRAKARKMLEHCTVSDSDDDQDREMRQALQHMLMLNTKAELQLLDATWDGMKNLLSSKLANL